MNLARLCARLKPVFLSKKARLKPVFLSKKGPSKARLLTKMSPSEELGTLCYTPHGLPFFCLSALLCYPLDAKIRCNLYKCIHVPLLNLCLPKIDEVHNGGEVGVRDPFQEDERMTVHHFSQNFMEEAA